MSCNYYLIKHPCPTCGHGEEKHVGSYSWGWRFLFQANMETRSFAEWKQQIAEPDVVLRDEYGVTVGLEEFVALVEGAKEGKPHPPGMQPFDDPEGYQFTEYEFS